MEALWEKLQQALRSAQNILREQDDHVRALIEQARVLHGPSSHSPSCIAIRNVANGYTYFYPGNRPLDIEWLHSSSTPEIAKRIIQAVRDAVRRGELPTAEQVAHKARPSTGPQG